MKRGSLYVAAMCALGGPTAGADQLPGTLNFADVTDERIIQNVGEQSSNEKEVEFGDFDNDNDLDVVIANAYSDFGTRKNKLYRNDGGVFNEISGSPDIPGFSGSDVSRNAFFRDYDDDGWLDIIIVNDNNTGGDGGRTKVYMNQHPGGLGDLWFLEEGEARLGDGTGGAACGAVSIDPDMDGDWDLYVGNYPGPSQDTMYFNDGTGFFTEMTGTHVPVDVDYTVDVSSADLNGDGKIDLLVSNGFGDFNFIYYNDNQGGGEEVGDFRYTGSTQSLGLAASENSMEPADFNNDDLIDFYWSNRSGNDDYVQVNTGNDGSNKAVFSNVTTLPDSVLDFTSRKATVADLNGDGRVDVFVMKGSGSDNRPTVLRNTTVDGAVSFVDWTPAPAFPTGTVHRGWHAAAFDSDGGGDFDIFIGGWSDDHLFDQIPGDEYTEGDLKLGNIPDVFDNNPAGVLGSVGEGKPDTYTIAGLESNGFLSVVLNGADDYVLEILDSGDSVLAVIDRGGAGVEEATQYDWSADPSTLKVRVTALDCANPANVIGDCGVGIEDFLELLAAWGPNPGHPADFDLDGDVDIGDFLYLLAHWGDSDYILEVLSRN